MPFSLLPGRVCGSIYDLSPAVLREAGITLLLADLDNTLAKYGQPEPDDRLTVWKNQLEAAGITLFLLSNSRKPTRAAHFAGALGIPYEGRAGKPKRGGYLRAMERMGCGTGETAMVGDQIYTDTLGANRVGILSILVEPIELRGNPGRYLRYAAEWPFRLAACRRTFPPAGKTDTA